MSFRQIGLQAVTKTISVSSNTANVTLDNDKYNIIETISPSATTNLNINIPSSIMKVQECGFEFEVCENSALSTIIAYSGGRKLPVKSPSAFDSTKLYQGTSLNGAIVIAEFEHYPIKITNVEATNETSSSIDLVTTGTMGNTSLPNNLEYVLALTMDGVTTAINAVGSTTTVSGTNYTNYNEATTASVKVLIDNKNYGEFVLKAGPTSVTIGDKTYKTIIIGNQEWLAENLDYAWDGLTVDSSTSDPRPDAWHYDNDETTYGWNGKKWGLLYDYDAVEDLINNEATLLPSGWHVPTQADFSTLISTISTDADYQQGLASTDDWTAAMAPREYGTDKYGFNLKPAGTSNEYYCNSSGYLAILRATDTLYALELHEDQSLSKSYFKWYNGYNYGAMHSIRLVRNLT